MDIEFDFEGAGTVRTELEDLEDAGTTEREYRVESGAEYSQYLEFGTRNMPPYPFFRPAVREARRDPDGFIDFEPETPAEYIQALAFALEAKMKANVTAQGSQDRSPGTHPDHPRSGFIGTFDGEEIENTGNLRARIQARRLK